LVALGQERFDQLHLLVRETHSLDDDAAAVDLGQTPADLVFLSFSDSDLSAAAMAWQAIGPALPTLRLANLARLRHPMSVDLYAARVIERARCVVVRLLGGLDYWRYGAEELSALCGHRRIALALLSGDEYEDTRLTELSTVPVERLAELTAYLRHGGPNNVGQALKLAALLGQIGTGPSLPPEPLPWAGQHPLRVPEEGPAGSVVIVFYRSHLLAGDVAPVESAAEALAARGLGVRAVYVSSLKAPEAACFISCKLRAWRPSVVLSATNFAVRKGLAASPLEAADRPILQLVLASSERALWEASARGLSQADLAMSVVLPELDGRLSTSAIAFKSSDAPLSELEFSPTVFRPDPAGIALAADRTAGWARLAATPRHERRLAVVLSDYSGAAGGQIGHAIGLDSFSSVSEIERNLHDAGYRMGGATDLYASLCHADPKPILELRHYNQLFATLPHSLQNRIIEMWGSASDDPAVVCGSIVLRHVIEGHLVVAVQPDRGDTADRRLLYHDPTVPPRHAYVAFYLWLREVIGVHAIIHLGAHGTLEWLPGKAVALSSACCPAAFTRHLPVIYPFIVNNPGEAAVAKRRLGAVMIGHLTPPLKAAGTSGATAELESLIDEFAAADGLDRRRVSRLRREILDRAAAFGLLAESGVGADWTDDEALTRLDAYLCDVKELQIRDGLHVFGRAPTPESRAASLSALKIACPGVPFDELAATFDASPSSEMTALLSALDGRFVVPGPAGAPTRGRADVLPTGRNLAAVDPRAIPTRSAVALAEHAAEELLCRHLQDHGDWPRSLVLDLWGSTTIRTGGEDLGLAFLLMGVRPTWDEGSARVTGIEVVPLSMLNRPRIDITLRISGLFRDIFETQILLFDSAVRSIAARDEDPAWNPIAASTHGRSGAALRRATTRVFGAALGTYGAGVADLTIRGHWRQRAALGEAYIAASGFAYGKGLNGVADAEGFTSRLTAADGFVHQQDHRETDLLDGLEYAAHAGGFAAAADSYGASPALYHLDTSQPQSPRARTITEELRRVVRGRAVNPVWIAGMMRHGYRGAAEIARTLEALFCFAATLPYRLDQQFDLLFDATLGDPTVDAFLQATNPAARAGMIACFDDALRRHLWQTKRNTVADKLRQVGT
jgi:cobaltochelatase CobN